MIYLQYLFIVEPMALIRIDRFMGKWEYASLHHNYLRP